MLPQGYALILGLLYL